VIGKAIAVTTSHHYLPLSPSILPLVSTFRHQTARLTLSSSPSMATNLCFHHDHSIGTFIYVQQLSIHTACTMGHEFTRPPALMRQLRYTLGTKRSPSLLATPLEWLDTGKTAWMVGSLPPLHITRKLRKFLPHFYFAFCLILSV